jgi:hypothetical protein
MPPRMMHIKVIVLIIQKINHKKIKIKEIIILNNILIKLFIQINIK